eukprot:CAMPEP_0119335648 /NCGR_PEP_ID=MMETSP1333-20130426/90023_1 /TAXON_ID=418940 /ORGANISM="Scyphosphaera apsteinii, Strain RCC1455" /LENGTH=226 /DNA_ID=CAMNT_0007346249 /DNA_START=202 /DNA_END=882 /DNA_ORIENTATION=-
MTDEPAGSRLIARAQCSRSEKIAVEVDLGADGEPKGVSRLTFKPLLKQSVLLQVDLPVPLGMVIEETDIGEIVITGALPGYSAIKQVEVGDLIRAVTAYREVLTGAPMWQQVISYTPVGKMETKRLIFRTEGATYADVRDSIASHRVEEGGNGMVTLLLERAVNDTTQMTPRDAEPAQLEPLQDVILRDLRKKPVQDAVEEEIKTLNPQERARRLFELGMGPDPDG